jgi:hypothetical protein
MSYHDWWNKTSRARRLESAEKMGICERSLYAYYHYEKLPSIKVAIALKDVCGISFSSWREYERVAV